MATVNEKMTAIADAIRDKTGGTEKLGLDGMAEGVNEVYDAGKTQGIAEGYNTGYTEGETAGIEQGKKAQYDEWWSAAYNSIWAAPTHKYVFAGKAWNDKTFNPKYSLQPVVAQGFFQECRIENLAEILERNGVTFDFSKNWNFGYFAYSTAIKHFPEVDMTKCDSSSNHFAWSQSLHTIDLIISSKTSMWNSAFYNCTALKNILFEGVIGLSIQFGQSPLTKDSIMGKLLTAEEYETLSETVKTNNVFEFNGNYYYGGIVTALANDTTGKTLQLKKTAVNNAFGIDIDDETTYPEGSEFYTLRHSKDNWTFGYM